MGEKLKVQIEPDRRAKALEPIPAETQWPIFRRTNAWMRPWRLKGAKEFVRGNRIVQPWRAAMSSFPRLFTCRPTATRPHSPPLSPSGHLQSSECPPTPGPGVTEALGDAGPLPCQQIGRLRSFPGRSAAASATRWRFGGVSSGSCRNAHRLIVEFMAAPGKTVAQVP